MAKNTKGNKQGKPGAPGRPVVNRLVFEVRYDYGYTYLDRCGFILNHLLAELPGWALTTANPKGTTLRNDKTGESLSFTWDKFDLSCQLAETVHVLPDISAFAQRAAQLAVLVVEGLSLEEELTRVGFRVWRLFPESSREEAAKRVKALELARLQPLENEGLEVEEVHLTFSLYSPDPAFCARIAISAAEQTVTVDPATLAQANIKPRSLSRNQRRARMAKLKADRAVQNFPHCAVLVDSDCFLEYPSHLGSTEFEDFINSSFGWSQTLASALLRPKELS